jgi:hypothetical protein
MARVGMPSKSRQARLRRKGVNKQPIATIMIAALTIMFVTASTGTADVRADSTVQGFPSTKATVSL